MLTLINAKKNLRFKRRHDYASVTQLKQQKSKGAFLFFSVTDYK